MRRIFVVGYREPEDGSDYHWLWFYDIAHAVSAYNSDYAWHPYGFFITVNVPIRWTTDEITDYVDDVEVRIQEFIKQNMAEVTKYDVFDVPISLDTLIEDGLSKVPQQHGVYEIIDYKAVGVDDYGNVVVRVTARSEPGQ